MNKSLWREDGALQAQGTAREKGERCLVSGVWSSRWGEGLRCAGDGGVPKKLECQAEDFGFYLERRGDVVRLAFQKDQGGKLLEVIREQAGVHT